MSDAKEWFVLQSGTEKGPFSLSELVAGVANIDSLQGISVRHPSKTKNDWIPAARIKPIVTAFADRPERAVVVQELPPAPGRVRCPFCNSTVGVYVDERISTAGWITVFALLLFLCIPLFWIGFFLKDRKTKCKACHMVLGQA